MKFTSFALSLFLTATVTQAATFSFPTASSTIVGSVGVIDPSQIGYFWSATRGDLVSETFADPAAFVTSLDLDLTVPTNVLSSGNAVNWDVILNGTTVGNFSIVSGFTGNFLQSYVFAPIASAGGYTVTLEVTNTVPGGGGSHTFGIGERYDPTVTFNGEQVPEPGTVALMAAGLAALAAKRRFARS